MKITSQLLYYTYPINWKSFVEDCESFKSIPYLKPHANSYKQHKKTCTILIFSIEKILFVRTLRFTNLHIIYVCVCKKFNKVGRNI